MYVTYYYIVLRMLEYVFYIFLSVIFCVYILIYALHIHKLYYNL